MRGSIVAGLLLLLGPAVLLSEKEVAQVTLNGHVFTLPAGFEIELAAGPPLIERPIVADFDEQGRLYVADSSGSNEKVEEQLKKKPHRIVRLEDGDGDGKFDKSVVFADQMMFPEGAMWLKGSLYVAAPPSIWKLTDTDGDGVADQRSEWFQGKTLTGCANDLHGPYLGPDGWIYWAKGAFAKQTHEVHGKPFVTRASHIFRARPDGTGIEPVMTGGMDNPVDVVFTPGGERIFTTTFFQHPGGGRRDGLIHAVYGGIYGKDHDVIHDPVHKWTGPELMPVLAHLGPAAPAGMCYAESPVLGDDLPYQYSVFVACFNMQKVTRHWVGPSEFQFQEGMKDFLVSNNRDFHPTDVLEDADGSLLVIDTGGWYKLCCPTSQLVKPDVLGAIYRVRRKNAPRVEDPRGLKLPWETMSADELAKLLYEAGWPKDRPAVRWRAVRTLADRKQDALPALQRVLSSDRGGAYPIYAVWALTQIDDPEARRLVRLALSNGNTRAHHAALNSISAWRDRGAIEAVLRVFKEESSSRAKNPRIIRAAAEALGRIGNGAIVPELLFSDQLHYHTGRVFDEHRIIVHSIIYALIEIGDADAVRPSLADDRPWVRRAAMIALDQIEGGNLDARMVAKDLASPNRALKEAAWWIAGRHPEWGGVLADFLRDRLVADIPAKEQEELVRQLSGFARSKAVQDLLAEQLRTPTTTESVRKIILRAMGQSAVKQTPAAWLDALAELSSQANTDALSDTIAAVRALPMPKQPPEKLVAALTRLVNDAKAKPEVRLSAAAAVPGGLAEVDAGLFELLRSRLGPDQPVAERSAAVEVLARAKLSSEQLLALVDSVKAAGPMEIGRLLEPFGQSSDETVGRKLLEALQSAAAKSALRIDLVKPRLAKFPAAVQKEAEELYAQLNVDLAKQKAKLEELLGKMKDGDVRRGQLVFNGTKAACSTCHAVGYLGGNIGPDLTRIGQIRQERDLLESIVFPNASFVQSYESVVVLTKDDRILNGVVKKNAPDEVVLALNADQTVRLARDEIAEMKPSQVSIMPAGLDQQLTEQELADLVAFLKACK